MKHLLFLFLVVAGAPAMAQSPALPARLSPEARVAAQRILDSASAAGVPLAPLTDKAAEGVLKGADDAHIVAALRTLLRQIEQAQDLLGDAAKKPMSYSLLGAMTSALQAGVPAADLRRLANPVTGPPEPRALVGALVTLVDLIAKRVPPSAASASIEELVRRRASEDQFISLRAEVADDIQRGEAPEAALAARTYSYTRALDAAQSAPRPLPRPPQPSGTPPL